MPASNAGAEAFNVVTLPSRLVPAMGMHLMLAAANMPMLGLRVGTILQCRRRPPSTLRQAPTLIRGSMDSVNA
jgi:hypothetical protein